MYGIACLFALKFLFSYSANPQRCILDSYHPQISLFLFCRGKIPNKGVYLE